MRAAHCTASKAIPAVRLAPAPSSPLHPKLQLAFAICAFAPIAEAAGFASSIDYALFTGITAMLLALLWIVGMVRRGSEGWLGKHHTVKPGHLRALRAGLSPFKVLLAFASPTSLLPSLVAAPGAGLRPGPDSPGS